MYAVLAATSKTGSSAVRALVEQGHAVRAIARDPKKAASMFPSSVEVVQADNYDVAALVEALKGVQGAFIVPPPVPDDVDRLTECARMSKAFKRAIEQAKVPRIVVLSSIGAELPEGTGPIVPAHRLESIIAKSAPEVIFIRAAYFMENWSTAAGAVTAKGILPSTITPLDYACPMIATKDIGTSAARHLISTEPIPSSPHIVNLQGPKYYSTNDIADALSSILGKKITPQPVPKEALLGFFGAFMRPERAEEMAELARAWLHDGVIGSALLTTNIERGVTSPEEVLRAYV